MICELIQYALKIPLEHLQNRWLTSTTEETNRQRPLWWNLQTVLYNRQDLDFRDSRRQKVKVEQFGIDIYSSISLVCFPTTLFIYFIIIEVGQPVFPLNVLPFMSMSSLSDLSNWSFHISIKNILYLFSECETVV